MSDSEAKQKLKTLFEEHGAGFRRFAWYRTGNEESADDIVRAAFVKLWEMRDAEEWPLTPGELYHILGDLAGAYPNLREVNMIFERDSYGGGEAANPEGSAANPEGSVASPEGPVVPPEQEPFQVRLGNCIAGLVPSARTTFLLHRIESLNYAEIADRLNISTKAVHIRIGLSIRLLSQCLTQKS